MVKKATQAIPNRLLQAARRERGWTQREVAECIGATSPLNVTRWERGVTTPSASYIEKLCQLFEASPQALGLSGETAEPRYGMTPVQAIQRVQLPEVSTTLWNVPHRRNPFFTGREDLLRELHKGLTGQYDIPGPPAQALYGLGGIGKTQLALEYVYRFREAYRAIFWVRAASYDTLMTDYGALARMMNLPERDAQDQQAMMAAVKRWLSQHQDWLLILDNADELSLLPDFLPTGSDGHLLLTTRAHAVGALAASLPVEELDEEEGMLLLLRRARVLASHEELASATPTERALAQTIVQELDGLPLALDQAGAYLEETGCSLADYLQLYHQRRHDLLTRRSMLVSDYPHTVASTWALSFEQVEQSNPAAAELLRLCAFLAPEAISEAMLKEGASVLGPVLGAAASDTLQWQEVMRVLRLFSLIRRDAENGLFSLHRLVQVVLRGQMDEPTQQQWAERAVRLVNAALPEVSFAAWVRLQECLPHAQVCATFIGQYQLRLPEAGRLLNHAGWYLRERALYTQAEPLLEQALALREAVSGPEHPDTATTLHLLGFLHHLQGRYGEVEDLCYRALAIQETVLGPEHPALAATLFDLGRFYVSHAHYARAEPLFQRALAISERVPGPEHPDTAQCLDGLVALYWKRGEYEQAEALCQRALAINEKALGPEHPDTAKYLSRLAVLYSNQGKYEQAEPLHQRTLAIYEQTLGPEHPSTADALTNLAVLYDRVGKYEQAEPFHQRALAILESLFDPHHPHIANCLNNLGFLYTAQGKYEQAEPLLQRALAIWEQALGPRHPDFSRTLQGLANLYVEQRRYEQAEPLYLRVLAIREEVLGANHLWTAETFYRLGRLYEVQEQDERALSFYERALEARETALGREHVQTVKVRMQLAELRRRMEQPDPGELTAREKEVLHLIAQGLTNTQIAEQLIITTHTVHAHVRSIYGKLGITTRSAATRYAVQHNLF